MHITKGQGILFKLLGLIAISIFVVYRFPITFKLPFFVLLLILYYRSKENYFWLAFFFILADAPGGFFPNADLHYGLHIVSSPIYLSAVEIFIYLSFFKAIQVNTKYLFVYKAAFILLGFYLLVILLTSVAMGTTLVILFKAFKMMLPYTLLYSIPKLISRDEDWSNFFKLLFPFTFIIILSQIYQLLTGVALSNYFGTDFIATNSEVSTFYNEKDPLIYAENVARPFISHFLGLIIMMGAVFYRLKKDARFNSRYLDMIIVASLIIPILSATRSFVIAYLIIFIAYIVLSPLKRLRILNIGIIGICISYILLSNSIIQGQLVGSFNRLSTMELIVSGDLTAGGTLDRLTEYTPVLLNYWKESPLFGWGFSSFFASETNSHAGFANLLFNVGIMGLILFMVYWVSLIYIPISVSQHLNKVNPYKKSILVFTFLFFSYFVLHNAGELFTYLIGFSGPGLSQIIYVSFSDFAIRDAKKINLTFTQKTLP